jgi:hypothetical protein
MRRHVLSPEQIAYHLQIIADGRLSRRDTQARALILLNEVDTYCRDRDKVEYWRKTSVDLAELQPKSPFTPRESTAPWYRRLLARARSWIRL